MAAVPPYEPTIPSSLHRCACVLLPPILPMVNAVAVDFESRLDKRCRAANALPKVGRKGFNSLVILVCWELWKHRNACVFEKIRPDAQIVFQSVVAEGHLWCLAEASALQDLFGPCSYIFVVVRTSK
ncbi:hypothetical protein U9M48_032920 [Paspalum notatum var. saurae]|uniref:Uncharacterized protein n=1 Tax=Paspalum notatum var. saurae TaxID=547442 RepID=A0AAQ3U881_PASNO